MNPRIEEIINGIIGFRLHGNKLPNDPRSRWKYHNMMVFLVAIVLDEHVFVSLMYAQPRVDQVIAPDRLRDDLVQRVVIALGGTTLLSCSSIAPLSRLRIL